MVKSVETSKKVHQQSPPAHLVKKTNPRYNTWKSCIIEKFSHYELIHHWANLSLASMWRFRGCSQNRCAFVIWLVKYILHIFMFGIFFSCFLAGGYWRTTTMNVVWISQSSYPSVGFGFETNLEILFIGLRLLITDFQKFMTS